MKVNWKQIKEDYPLIFQDFLDNAPLSNWCGYNKNTGKFHTLNDYSEIPDAAIIGVLETYGCKLAKERFYESE